ncbi:MAG: tRNA delta(2)-isopentenylpyrophosphate transferase, tRNA dimethylallyltransferase [Microgenomates group bacterium GW2011_GWC1_41_8]|uniref:tRNA dimethylallyltransferase n=2 Tax=Candidatus Roizmaniibacteriota TaxID=1752723 RepID=A0A0G0T364_9BACT|nr:MAG: tRNA dimethylallyltransferase [Candidatus Roizmanbacteria bacterium GW2011_GWB1_40_7]KKR93328.1 MAG: tRNA dimethylallyltransferase [Candidatus Roizmanbacteria bacterium GW2011_GWA1_41_13]KKS23251.1 MAG: tRNA delta(2)-isopentenylpyrophosphate transferase, tRNA dimethylallyltransferase [Microgenomates group bacterium GW2011_GWC1_41_8]OGK50791.1 MAG: tRNA (adenosine(37)-N6)-dimethylallyltransferase MiaA [Candidatus Roizmanbacteria bacterium RIFCSPLOWO2_01_FULL_40_14]
MSNSLLVVCGPTATGKTEYALKLAKEKNGELVSADSRQIYKYLDIGTGKDLPQNTKYQILNTELGIADKNYSVGYYLVNNVPLWLYDVITPDQRFSAAEYARLARIVINDIWSRGKLPIVVGGTGFYIKALVGGIDTEGIPPNQNLRKKLEDCSTSQLQKTLHSLNPQKLQSMNHSDKNNPRRLVRAIEIEEYKKLQPQTTGLNNSRQITNNVNFIGLNIQREELFKRIDERVEKRVEQGIIDEIKNVLKMGYGWDSPGLYTIGYKEWQPYFEGKETKEAVVQKWKFNEHSYARRQLTWFKKDKRIKWIPAVT